jgi:hypothetical protein
MLVNAVPDTNIISVIAPPNGDLLTVGKLSMFQHNCVDGVDILGISGDFVKER